VTGGRAPGAGGRALLAALIGLALAGPAGRPAAAQVFDAAVASLDCGVTAVGAGVLEPPLTVSDGTEGVFAGVPLTQPCGGPVVVTVVLELGGSPPFGAEGRLRVRALCLGAGGTVAGAGAACLEDALVPLTPQKVVLPVPFVVNLQEVGSDTRAVTFGGTLPRGRYLVAVDLEAVAGDLTISKAYVHALGGGHFPARAPRFADPASSSLDRSGAGGGGAPWTPPR
jgi:hypothetical protein